jgi:hypothetical protein
MLLDTISFLSVMLGAYLIDPDSFVIRKTNFKTNKTIMQIKIYENAIIVKRAKCHENKYDKNIITDMYNTEPKLPDINPASESKSSSTIGIAINVRNILAINQQTDKQKQIAVMTINSVSQKKQFANKKIATNQKGINTGIPTTKALTGVFNSFTSLINPISVFFANILQLRYVYTHVSTQWKSVNNSYIWEIKNLIYGKLFTESKQAIIA